MYYTIVLIIAIVVLISSLSIVGVMMTTGSNKIDFPEFQNTCPDYWTLDGTICKPPISKINVPNSAAFAGSSPSVAHAGVVINQGPPPSITSLDLTTSNWTSICDKSSWAKMNGIVWDGVSNTNQC